MKSLHGLFRKYLGHRALALSVVAAGCGDPRQSMPDTAARAPAADSVSPLDSAALSLVAFLRGDEPYPERFVADSVRLLVPREGGGGSVVASRERLRLRANWQVKSGRATYVFPPPGTNTKLTAKQGVHFNCFEQPLASRVPGFAGLPHVGVKLEPPDASSCLQAWNVTFVFDSSRRLVAAVYDQFEW